MKNNVVLWDRIIRRKRDAKLKLKGIKPKYRFREISKSFKYVRLLAKERNELKWEILEMHLVLISR